MRRRVMSIAALVVAGSVMLSPQIAAAEGLFDLLFGALTGQPQRPTPQANLATDSAIPQPPQQRAVTAGGSGAAFCVRSCDGRYFPLMRGAASPAQMCQAFCPASATKVYFGASIDDATAANGEHYADSDNAYAYRKALRADCTCNGRDPAGLAPIDLALDNSLRPGDVVATTDGLVAYSGPRGGSSPTADFTPVSSYPGLTADVRARLNEIRVAPVRAEMVASDALPNSAVSAAPPTRLVR
jgi:hypothetical protein